MKLLHIAKDKQPTAAFDGGSIQERRLVIFPNEAGYVHSFSALFYWAYAWGERDGLIAEHPHRGFEIMSYVLEGSLEHYDSVERQWKQLDAGDAQLMKAGAGISHSERVAAGSRFFQIWFDPGLQHSLTEEARYADYRCADFPVRRIDGLSVRIIAGSGSPLSLNAPVKVSDVKFAPGEHAIDLPTDAVLTAFVIKGKPQIQGAFVKPEDFLLISETDTVTVSNDKETRVFMIETPRDPGYRVMSGA